MGLEFTTRPDREGPAIYAISDGSPQSTEQLKQLATEIDTSLPDDAQVVLLEATEREGAEIIDFYDIETLPAVLIVLDDDEIYQSWYTQLPTAEQVLYEVGQAGGRLVGDQ